MGWARFDDGYAFHPKLVAAGLEARGLDAAGICYSQAQSTDGFVPDAVVNMLAGTAAKGRQVAQRLVDVGRWARHDDRCGYLIHDYLEYNDSRKKVEEKKAAERDRKAAGRATQAKSGKPKGADGRWIPTGHETESDRTADGIQADSARIPGGVPHVPPHPTVKPSGGNSSNAPPSEPDEDQHTPNGTAPQPHPQAARIANITAAVGWAGPRRTADVTAIWDWAAPHLDHNALETTLAGCVGADRPNFLRTAARNLAKQAHVTLPEIRR